MLRNGTTMMRCRETERIKIMLCACAAEIAAEEDRSYALTKTSPVRLINERLFCLEYYCDTFCPKIAFVI